MLALLLLVVGLLAVLCAAAPDEQRAGISGIEIELGDVRELPSRRQERPVRGSVFVFWRGRWLIRRSHR